MSAKWMMALVVILLLNACAAGPTMPSSEERQALSPTGKLRLGLLVGGATAKDPVTGELRGPAIDIGRELARRVEVSFEPIAYGAVAELINDAPKDKWDAIAIAINPERLKAIDFSDPYAQIEMGVLVGKGAPISALGEHELRSGSLNPTSSCQEDA